MHSTDRAVTYQTKQIIQLFPKKFPLTITGIQALLLISVLAMTKSLHPVALDLSFLNSTMKPDQELMIFHHYSPIMTFIIM